MKDILIKNGTIICPKQNIEGVFDLLIKNKKIAKIAKNISSLSSVEKINAKGKIVTPGLFDMHVHLREPGREDKETIETAMKAALNGGITSLLSMPNTNPITNNQAAVEFQLSKAAKLNLAKLFVAGKITKEETLAEMREMKLTGIVAVTNDGEDVENAMLLKRALQWAKTFDLPLLTHAEIKSLSKGGVMHEGKISLKLGLLGIPSSAENLAIQKSIILAEEIDAKLHISHLSTKEGVKAVRDAKKRKVKVTAETTPHHFSLTDQECLSWNTNAKMYPPLREKEDLIEIQKGLQDDTIEVIATDHAPHLTSEKLLPFDEAPRGTVGLETLFAAVNTFLIKPKILSLKKAIAKMTTCPAKILNLPQSKGLKIGQNADVAIFDINKKWIVDENKFYSKGKNSVFRGKTLYGKATETIVNGEFKVKNGLILNS